MQRKLPGIDIPAATEAKILHAAAFLEFKSHVERLAREGSDLAAYTCWMHGIEVLHSPYVITTGTDSELFPPCRSCLVASMTASAAQLMSVGSSSRGLACGIAGELCCPMMWRPRMLGSTITSTRTQWTYCWLLPTRTSKWQPTLCPKTSTACSSGAQRVTLGNWAWERCLINGGAGSDVWALMSSCRPSSSRASSQELPGGDPGQHGAESAQGLIGRYVDGWKARTQEFCNLARPAQSAETLPGACVGHAAWGCVVPASPGGSHVNFVEDVRRCLPKVDTMTEAAPLKSPQHLFALRTLAILIGCSAMASGGKGYYAAQAAASSSSGGDPAPGWRAADSLMMIAAQRARQWREGEGLLDDNDFAHAYTDYDQVVGLAGHHVADDWLQTRARVEEELLAAGAKVVEDNPKGSVTLRPVRKTIYKKKPKAVNVDKNLSEAVQKRVNGLVSMFIGMGAYKPAGILTDNLKAEWKQTCRRIAEKKVKDAEKATIDRVVNTWLELRAFLESRGRPAPPEMVDLDQFLNHTTAPSRAPQALKWMNKNADQDLELGNLQVPTTPRATGSVGKHQWSSHPLCRPWRIASWRCTQSEMRGGQSC